MNISESVWSSLKLVSKFFMIEPELIQDRSLHIVRCYFSTNGIVSDFISFSITKSFPDSATRHPDCECVDVMVPALEGILFSFSVFLHRCSSKFPSPDHQRLVK